MKNQYSCILLFIFLCFKGLSSFAQSDAVRIAEAKYALEYRKDYPAAKLALEEVSDSGKKQQEYVFYMAKTLEFLKDYNDAILFYNKFLEFEPNNPDITQRVVELSYNARKTNAINAEKERKEKELNDKYLSKFEQWFNVATSQTFQPFSPYFGKKITFDKDYNVWHGNTLVFKAADKKVTFCEWKDDDGVVHASAKIFGQAREGRMNLDKKIDYAEKFNDSNDKDYLEISLDQQLEYQYDSNHELITMKQNGKNYNLRGISFKVNGMALYGSVNTLDNFYADVMVESK